MSPEPSGLGQGQREVSPTHAVFCKQGFSSPPGNKRPPGATQPGLGEKARNASQVSGQCHRKLKLALCWRENEGAGAVLKAGDIQQGCTAPQQLEGKAGP